MNINNLFNSYIKNIFNGSDKHDYFDIIKYHIDTCTDALIDDYVFPYANTEYEIIYDSRKHVITDALEVQERETK